jgi:NAD(P)-dependent dehydrogenase (short-subunit alcohol dehydrogenase family)
MRIREVGVLVTGASRGIGKALALELGRRRCRVALVSRNPDELELVAREVRGLGGEAAVYAGDVADAQAMDDLAQQAASWLGRWQVVIANAGVGFHGEEWRASPEEVGRVVSVNFLGVVNTIRAAVPYLRQHNPSAVGVVSSLSALIPYRGGGVYAASKAAINAYLSCLKLDLRGTGIAVSGSCGHRYDRGRGAPPQAPPFGASGCSHFEAQKGGKDPATGFGAGRGKQSDSLASCLFCALLPAHAAPGRMGFERYRSRKRIV